MSQKTCSQSGCKVDLFKDGLCLSHFNKLKGKERTKVKAKVSKNKDTINGLLVSLKTQPKFAKMAEYSVECLKNLAVDEVSVEEMIEAGTVEAMMDVLKHHPENEKLQKMVNDTLLVFSKNERLAKMISDRMGGRLDVFANSLKKHTDLGTVLTTCKSVEKFATTAAQRAELTKQGMLEALASLVKKHRTNLDVLAAAAAVAARFAADHDSAVELLKNGTVEVILAAAKLHPEHAQLAESTAALLASLGQHKDLADQLKAMGAVDVLMACLEAHPYNEALIASARAALTALTGVSDMELALRGMVSSGTVNLTPEIAAALSKLSSLVLVEDNVAYLMKNGGVGWLVALLNTAVGQAASDVAGRAMANGARVLQRVATNESNIYEIFRAGGVKALVSILHKHMDDAAAAEAALSALAQMISRKENAMFIAKSGGIAAAVAALNAHPGNLPINRAAMSVFQGMSSFEETTDLLIKAGAMKAVSGVFDRHGADESIANLVVNTLGRMANSTANVTAMSSDGLVQALLNIIRKHFDNAAVVKEALYACEVAALLPENLERFRKLGGPDLIKGVMDRHGDDVEIQEVGERLLALIRGDASAEEENRKWAEEKRKREEAEVALERKRADDIEQQRQAIMSAEVDRLKRLKFEYEQNMAVAQKREAEMTEKMKQAQELAEQRRRELDEHERLEKYRLDMLKKMAEEQKVRDLEEIARRRMALEQEEHALRIKADALRKTPELPKPVRITKSAKAIFAAEEEEQKKIELPPDVKNLLLAGALMKKHAQDNPMAAKPRHLYVTNDLVFLVWKHPKKELSSHNRMQVSKIFGVETGLCTKALQRKRFGRYLADPDLAFSITGSDDEGNLRAVDLEARSTAEREKWVTAIEALIQWCKDIKLYGLHTVHMERNALLKDGEDGNGVPLSPNALLSRA